jgi:hypothetical protein
VRTKFALPDFAISHYSMFKISQSISNQNGLYSSAGFKILSPPIGYAALAKLPISPEIPLTIDPTSISIAGGIASLPIPIDFQASSIEIDGRVYQFTLDRPPSKGYFTLVNGNLVIGLFDDRTLPSIIAYYPYTPPIPTDFIPAPYPEICTEFPLKGELSWTLTWEEQPSGTMSFITLASERSRVISYFSSTRSIDVYGVGFSPSGQFSITDISLSKSATPLIEVSVSLGGYHAKFLDYYATVGKQFFLPDCTAPPLGQLNSPDTMSVQTFAGLVGTSLSGAAIYIDPKVLTSPAIPTTLSAQLQPDSVRVAGGFIDYNSSGSIQIKSYNSVSSHSIREVDIRSDIRANINNKLNANASEYGFYKTYDPLTKVSFGSQATIAPNTKSPKPTWQPKQPVISKTVEGDPRPDLNPYEGIQRDLSIVFDISGKKKRRKDIDLIDGQPIHESEQEWGWTAVMASNGQFAGASLGNIAGSWRKISSKETYYTYNENNYLTNVTSRGFILGRYRTENPQKPESLAIKVGNPPDPKQVANLQTFEFQYIGTYSSETYRLVPFSDYYSDIVAPTVQWSICLPDGQPVEISLTDKSWIPPYFAIEKTVKESSFISTENPISTSLKPLPPLTAGKDSLFVERIVVEPKQSLTLSILDKPKDPTSYTKSTDDQSSGGSQFNANLSIAKGELVNGRPPIATNRGALLEIVKPPDPIRPVLNLKPFAISSGLSGENTGYVTVGNINFPTAYSEAQALAAAQIDIDLINSKNTLQETMTIDWRPEIRPGDLVTYSVNGDTRRRRVISVTQTIRIDGMVGNQPFVTSTGTQLKLGIDAKTPIKVINLPERRSEIFL